MSWARRCGRTVRYLQHRIGSPQQRTLTLVTVVTGIFLVIFYFHLVRSNVEDKEVVPEDRNAVLLQIEPISVSGQSMERYPVVSKRPTIFPGVDDQHMHGRIGCLEDGTPTWRPDSWFEFRKQTMEEKEEAHRGYCFNTAMGKSLSLDRKIPDFNSKECKAFFYGHDLPTADVVIVFHGEDLAVLLRSIHSILNRTPPHLLESIILVNDNSDPETHPWLFADLAYHIQYLPKVKLVHLTERRGLMMARVEGSAEGSAPVVVYLDSHIECGNRWLEPMLYAIKQDYKTIVTPRIHTIDAENFEFEQNALSVLSFSWSLGQTHPPDVGNSNFEPEVSPVMAGGLFAASRKWFLDELEGYDPEMKLYGGEEMEIGFKTWQCGGSLYNLPCSHVGHVFRTDKYWKGQVYKVPMEEIVRNKRRVAEVWMDEYVELFDLVASPLPETHPLGDLSGPRGVREKLQCKSFQWFLNTVVKNMYVPRNVSESPRGNVGNIQTGLCIDTLQKKAGKIGVFGCHGHHGSQAFLLDVDDKSLRVGADSFASCVYISKSGELHMGSCNRGPAARLAEKSWEWIPVAGAPLAEVPGPANAKRTPQGLMKHLPSNKCLAPRKPQKRLGQQASPAFEAILVDCDEADPTQWWVWEFVD